MLETIIKRDGREEPADPAKLNHWTQWSMKGLEGRVDWSSIVLKTFRTVGGKKVHSKTLQSYLIKNCLDVGTWACNIMAGRLYIANLRKDMFDNKIPTVKEMHQKLISLGLMEKLAYNDEEYEIAQAIIDHEKDFKLAHFQIEQDLKKYSLRNKVTGVSYETPQFIYMRMAMALSQDDPVEERFIHICNFYKLFSDQQLNAPTPNYDNLGTEHRGYASCNLYTAGDTAKSLAIGDHIAYTMTYMSAGIGGNLNCRSKFDPVRGGAVEHQGKIPYYQAVAKAVKANLKGGRGGSCTEYFSCFDPEADTIIMLQNPRTPYEDANRDIHFAMLCNRFFAKKAKAKEDIFTFNVYTAPDLTAKFYSSDEEGFEALYNKYEADPNFKKNYVSAYRRLLNCEVQGHQVSTMYSLQIDEANRHTSFKETIYSSNLCVEVIQPTAPYYDMKDLYSTEDHGRGEVGLCNIFGIVVSNIDDDDDETYALVAYYGLRMVDKCIHLSHYELPHLGVTAKARLNAAAGVVGLAHSMAKKNLRYDSKEGLEYAHWLAERHTYHVIKASLKLGKELGNAPWIHKTKWPDGWLPIDTYKRDVDEIVAPNYRYDWEALRQEIIENGGIRNSSLIAHMPTESSSKASGAPNGLYPIRDLGLKKSDVENSLNWCAPDNDIIGHQYQLAYDIDTVDMIKFYAVWQKFCDQSISADYYINRVKIPELTNKMLLIHFFTRVKYGVKSKYYQNSYTVDVDSLDQSDKPTVETTPASINEVFSNERAECAGACTL